MNKEEFADLIKDYGSACSQTTFEDMEGTPRSYGRAERDKQEAWRDTMEALEDYLNAARRAAWDEGLQAGQDRWMDNREFGDKPVNPYREKAS